MGIEAGEAGRSKAREIAIGCGGGGAAGCPHARAIVIVGAGGGATERPQARAIVMVSVVAQIGGSAPLGNP